MDSRVQVKLTFLHSPFHMPIWYWEVRTDCLRYKKIPFSQDGYKLDQQLSSFNIYHKVNVAKYSVLCNFSTRSLLLLV